MTKSGYNSLQYNYSAYAWIQLKLLSQQVIQRFYFIRNYYPWALPFLLFWYRVAAPLNGRAHFWMIGIFRIWVQLKFLRYQSLAWIWIIPSMVFQTSSGSDTLQISFFFCIQVFLVYLFNYISSSSQWHLDTTFEYMYYISEYCCVIIRH